MAIDHDWPDDPDEEIVIGGEVFARGDIEYKKVWFGARTTSLFDFEKMRKNKETRLLKEGHFHKDERSIDERMTGAIIGQENREALKRLQEQSLPDNNPKTAFGIKKPPLHLIPKPFLIILSKVMGLGAKKYGAFNWRSNQVAASVYLGALERHVASWADGESIDPESGVSHLAHAAACIAILLDAQETGNLVDDRPPPGAAARLIKELSDA